MTMFAAMLQHLIDAGTPLYIGFVSETNFVQYDLYNDEMSSHAGWEEYTGYAQADRQLWDPASIVGRYPATVKNPAGGVITPNAAARIVGVFLCDDDTKGGATGQLYGPFPLPGGPMDLLEGKPFKAIIEFGMATQTLVI